MLFKPKEPNTKDHGLQQVTHLCHYFDHCIDLFLNDEYIRVFFSKFLMGGGDSNGDEVRWGGLAKKIRLKPKMPT